MFPTNELFLLGTCTFKLSITTGAIAAGYGSELNFIGIVLFESNHAFDDGGKGKIEHYLSAIPEA